MKKVFTLLLLCIGITMSVNAQSRTAKSFSEAANLGIFYNDSPIQSAPQPATAGTPLTSSPLTYYNDRSVFNADVPGLPIEGFESSSIPNSTLEAFGMPLNESSNTTYINPGDILPGISISASAGSSGSELVLLGTGYAGSTSKVVISNTFIASNILTFNPPVTAVGFDVIEFMGGTSCNIEIYNASSTLIASTTSSSSNSGVFWGVTSTTPISRIVIFSTSNGAEGADNIAFGNTAPTVPISNWAIYLLFVLILGTTLFRFRKMIFQ